MKISTKGRHAVRMLIDIATAGKEYVSISEIATRQGISNKYLEQIASKLVKAKLLASSMGSLGGYKLTKDPSDYTIAEILTVTGDAPELVPCMLNGIHCDHRDKCTTIGYWETLNKMIYDYLASVTLQDVIDKTY